MAPSAHSHSFVPVIILIICFVRLLQPISASPRPILTRRNRRDPRHVRRAIRSFTASELVARYELMVQYKHANVSNCPFAVRYEGQAVESNGTIFLSHNDVSIGLTNESILQTCSGYPDAVLGLISPAFMTDSQLDEFESSISDDLDKKILFDSVQTQLGRRVYLISSPTTQSRFKCGGVHWFSCDTLFLLFDEADTIMLSVVSEVSNDVPRVLTLPLVGNIRYMIAVSFSSTCVYRVDSDVRKMLEDNFRPSNSPISSPMEESVGPTSSPLPSETDYEISTPSPSAQESFDIMSPSTTPTGDSPIMPSTSANLFSPATDSPSPSSSISVLESMKPDPSSFPLESATPSPMELSSILPTQSMMSSPSDQLPVQPSGSDSMPSISSSPIPSESDLTPETSPIGTPSDSPSILLSNAPGVSVTSTSEPVMSPFNSPSPYITPPKAPSVSATSEGLDTPSASPMILPTGSMMSSPSTSYSELPLPSTTYYEPLESSSPFPQSSLSESPSPSSSTNILISQSASPFQSKSPKSSDPVLDFPSPSTTPTLGTPEGSPSQLDSPSPSSAPIVSTPAESTSPSPSPISSDLQTESPLGSGTPEGTPSFSPSPPDSRSQSPTPSPIPDISDGPTESPFETPKSSGSPFETVNSSPTPEMTFSEQPSKTPISTVPTSGTPSQSPMTSAIFETPSLSPTPTASYMSSITPSEPGSGSMFPSVTPSQLPSGEMSVSPSPADGPSSSAVPFSSPEASIDLSPYPSPSEESEMTTDPLGDSGPTDPPLFGRWSCFPGSLSVTLESGIEKPISSLQIGDSVHVGEASSHPLSCSLTETQMLKLTLSEQIRWGSGSLLASAGHFVYLNGRLKAMREVKIGDKLLARCSEKNGVCVSETVVNVTTVLDSGLYNPQTLTGDIMVNGFKTSCYTEAVQPGAAHGLLLPMRLLQWVGYQWTRPLVENISVSVLSSIEFFKST